MIFGRKVDEAYAPKAKYLLKVRKISGASAYLIDDENEALRRMKHWAKHPLFISAEVRKVETVAVPYSVLIASEVRKYEVAT